MSIFAPAPVAPPTLREVLDTMEGPDVRNVIMSGTFMVVDRAGREVDMAARARAVPGATAAQIAEARKRAMNELFVLIAQVCPAQYVTDQWPALTMRLVNPSLTVVFYASSQMATKGSNCYALALSGITAAMAVIARRMLPRYGVALRVFGVGVDGVHGVVRLRCGVDTTRRPDDELMVQRDSAIRIHGLTLAPTEDAVTGEFLSGGTMLLSANGQMPVMDARSARDLVRFSVRALQRIQKRFVPRVEKKKEAR